MGRSTPFNDPPAWVADAVVYQIFPDRFRRSGRVEAQQHLTLDPWGTLRAKRAFKGDLLGVIDGLDHLQSMGICLYLTPIFSSPSTILSAYDYFQVDPLGGNEAWMR